MVRGTLAPADAGVLVPMTMARVGAMRARQRVTRAVTEAAW
jgi:hypothetical protein